MEFHVHKQNGSGEPITAHIMTTHSAADDDSPLQMISLAQLAHYRRCEANLISLLMAMKGISQ